MDIDNIQVISKELTEKYGTCKKCNQPNTHFVWCKMCELIKEKAFIFKRLKKKIIH